VIKDTREKLASLLPGNMTESMLMELWAAMREVDVMYSEKRIGASASCSAKSKTECTAEPATGRRTVLPPKRAWSTTDDVRTTAV